MYLKLVYQQQELLMSRFYVELRHSLVLANERSENVIVIVVPRFSVRLAGTLLIVLHESFSVHQPYTCQ